MAVFSSMAQDVERESQSEDFARRYDMMVSRLGYAGVGIETLLDNWEKVDPENEKLLVSRYLYYFTKSKTTSVDPKPVAKYLGNKPLLSLKDSTGMDIHYFEVTEYDDSLYSMAVRNLDRVIRLKPNDLSYHFMKAASLVAYEKESPDMALSYLDNLIDTFYAGDGKGWTYPDAEVDDVFFKEFIQEYCYTFYTIGTVSSYEAFRALSERMLGIYPKDVVFLTNMGTYYFIGLGEYRQALKYYNKVLKIKPDDYAAIKNCVLLCRKSGNVKAEKKYLSMLVKYGPENDAKAAKARLDALNG